MRRSFILTLCILILIFAVPGCISSPVKDKIQSIDFHETPMTFVLVGGNTFFSMPTITLYKNGNALITQPPISSLFITELGHYQISGSALTVTHGENMSATFSISDGGDKLTLESSNIGYTKVGSVYQYRSKKDYLSGFNKIEGKKLTLELVRELAKKAQNLTVADFEKYAHVDLDPDYHVFDIEEEYTLNVIYTAEGDTNCTIEKNSSGESFPLNLNGSTGFVFDEFLGLEKIPNYQARKWLDYYLADYIPWHESIDLSLPEFPGVTFTWTSAKVTANGIDMILGMPVWNVYLVDLTNDGKPEFCATVSFGSGIVDTRVVVVDYADHQAYELADRMNYDFHLSMEDGKIMVTQTEYPNGKPIVKTELRLVKGKITGFEQ